MEDKLQMMLDAQKEIKTDVKEVSKDLNDLKINLVETKINVENLEEKEHVRKASSSRIKWLAGGAVVTSLVTWLGSYLAEVLSKLS